MREDVEGFRPNVVELFAAMDDIMRRPQDSALQEELLKVGLMSADSLAAHMSAEHSVPSPSSLGGCRRAMWYSGTGAEREEEIPAHWTKRMVVGTLIENYWIALLNLTGQLPLVTRTDYSPKIGEHMSGTADGFIGERGLVEFKDKSGWMYKRLIEGQGLAYVLPKEYMQVQSYLYGYKKDYCLYLASAADPGMLQGQMRNWKKYGEKYNLPVVYLEVIEARTLDQVAALARADMVHMDLESDAVPPREYAGEKRDGLYECNVCPYLRQCQEDGV